MLVRVRAGGPERDRQRASGPDDGTDDPAPAPAGARRDAAGTVEAVGPGHQRGARRRNDRAHAAGSAGPPGHAGRVRTAADRRGHGRVGRLDFTTAAAIPLAGMAALAAVDAIGAKPGQVVLVAGAAGARGHAMAAVLAAAGRTVVAAGRSEQALRDLT